MESNDRTGSNQFEAQPEYQWLREFKEAYGKELCARHGAHSIGIGLKQVAGKRTDQLALLFYVSDKQAIGQLPTEAIPPSFKFTPAGMNREVELATDVIESPPAEFEFE